MDPFFLLDKEKIDADESKFEKEVWKAKHLGILALIILAWINHFIRDYKKDNIQFCHSLHIIVIIL